MGIELKNLHRWLGRISTIFWIRCTTVSKYNQVYAHRMYALRLLIRSEILFSSIGLTAEPSFFSSWTPPQNLDDCQDHRSHQRLMPGRPGSPDNIAS